MTSRYYSEFKEKKVGPGGARPQPKRGKDASGSVKDKQGPYPNAPFERSRKGRYA